MVLMPKTPFMKTVSFYLRNCFILTKLTSLKETQTQFQLSFQRLSSFISSQQSSKKNIMVDKTF